MQATMAFLYWSGVMTWRRMVTINMCGTLLLIIYLLFNLKDSPQYLYSKGKFTELAACLTNIAKRNGVYRQSMIQTAVAKLELTKSRE